jgi:shikimate dehydrogenase/3-dehydroquinate dehydratase type I
MSGGRPEIVVSLPARTVEDARRQADAARVAGADLAEVRIDRWPARERGRVSALFPSSLPLVATLRSRAEGGEGPDDPASRDAALMELARSPFDWVDLEASRDRRLEESVRSLGRRVVRSSHLPAEASDRELDERLGESAPKDGLLKVVVPATFTRAVRDLLPRLERSRSPRPVLLTTGPSGTLWRAWAGRGGAPWVYAALPRSSAVEPVEPSQLPADQLGTFLAAPDAPIFAVVGHPVAHSLSPALHHAWMRRDGHPGLYVPLDLDSPEEFRLAVETLPSRGVRGLNVTHPWKQLAFECAGSRRADAIATGAANCLTFEQGAVVADNTDLEAIRRRMDELKEQGHWEGRRLTVLGGGGAARATLAAARELGATALVLTRRRSVADALALEFGAEVGDPAHPEPTPLLVHATNVGRAGAGGLELPLRALLDSRSYVLDWVYSPDVRTLEEVARSSSTTYEDGVRLLVYQAAASYERWWGRPPDPESVEEAVREVGCAA